MLNLNSVAALASAGTFEQSANAFAKSIEYSVQPTDDGKSVFTELTAALPISEFLNEITVSAIARPIIEANKLQQAKQAEAQRIQTENEAESARSQAAELEKKRQSDTSVDDPKQE